MCGKCEPMMAKIACGSIGLGMLFILSTAVSRILHCAPMGLGPRSFATGAALLLLLSIALHTCKSACHTEGH